MENIKQLLSSDKTDEAIEALNRIIEENPTSDEAYYLRGKAFRKKEMFKEAITDFLTALEINEDSPAAIAYKQAVSIMEYYNKDLQNP
jgi:tetratricopeptide (TPR) repeat protein